MVSKVEWEAILKQWNHRCAFCGKTEKQVGTLEKAHLKSGAKGGSQIIPLCPSHHAIYDKGNATVSQLKKIGVDPAKYKRYIPPKKGGGKDSSKGPTLGGIRRELDRGLKEYGL